MHILEAIAIVIAVGLLGVVLTVIIAVLFLRNNPSVSGYEDVQAVVSKMKEDPISDDVCGFCHNTGVITGVYDNIPCSCTAALKRGFINESRDRIDIHC